MTLTSDSKVLIIRLSSIGDIIVCSPIIRCIKLQLGCEVHFLVKKKFAEVQQSNPYIDKHYEYEDEQLQTKLKAEKYDLIVDLHKNARTFRIKSYLSVRTATYNKINLQKWLMVNLKINRLPSTHLVDRYFAALEHIGISNDGKGLDYFYDSAEQLKIDLPVRFIALVIGAAHYTKQIPTDLCEAIIREQNIEVVLLGGQDEIEKGKQIEEKISCINLVGKLSLDQSAMVILKSNAVITGDTGLMHLAAALRKPIISIWGSTSPVLGMFPYFGEEKVEEKRINLNLACQPCTKIGKKQCPKGHFDCMNKLSANDIISQTNQILLRN